MSKTKWCAWLLASWVGCGLLGCQVNRDIRSPEGFLPSGAGKVARNAFGGWMVAALNSAGSLQTVEGELLTIHHDSVYLLSSSRLEVLPVSELVNAKLELHLQNPSGFVAWTLIGSLSTLSHGAYLLFSAPIWVITGTSMASGVNRQPNMLFYPASGLDEFKKFSRFPQGLPPGVDPAQLVPKPLAR